MTAETLLTEIIRYPLRRNHAQSRLDIGRLGGHGASYRDTEYVARVRAALEFAVVNLLLEYVDAFRPEAVP